VELKSRRCAVIMCFDVRDVASNEEDELNQGATLPRR
jgi:hypothetical protein